MPNVRSIGHILRQSGDLFFQSKPQNYIDVWNILSLSFLPILVGFECRRARCNDVRCKKHSVNHQLDICLYEPDSIWIRCLMPTNLESMPLTCHNTPHVSCSHPSYMSSYMRQGSDQSQLIVVAHKRWAVSFMTIGVYGKVKIWMFWWLSGNHEWLTPLWV
jgi:hypothetical protein